MNAPQTSAERTIAEFSRERGTNFVAMACREHDRLESENIRMATALEVIAHGATIGGIFAGERKGLERAAKVARAAVVTGEVPPVAELVKGSKLTRLEEVERALGELEQAATEWSNQDVSGPNGFNSAADNALVAAMYAARDVIAKRDGHNIPRAKYAEASR